MKIKVSVGVIIHNEEKTLDRCLLSFFDIVDEIIVIHDGPCTDRSLEIAKKYTKNIFVRKWVGCCEGHYGFFKQKAKNDWILLVDADEYLSTQLRNNLKKLISQKDVSAFEVCWPTYSAGRKFVMGLDRKFYKRILFRKSDVLFDGYAHERRNVRGVVKKVEYPLIHKPTANMFTKEYIYKKEKWADVSSKMLLSKGVSYSRYYYFFKAPLWFVLYLVYYMIFRMYFISGMIGVHYAWMYSKYAYRLNMNIFRGKK